MARRSVEEVLAGVLAQRPEVLEAYLFGSFARGQARAHSDLDVAVFLGEPPAGPFGVEADLAAALIAATGSNRVDLVVLNRAPPLLVSRVLRDGVRLCSRDLRATTAREGRALSRAYDFAPQRRKYLETWERRLDSGRFGR